MPLPSTVAYEDTHGTASWRSECVDVGGELDEFLADPVATRLDDAAGTRDFRDHLRGLALTGMGRTALEEVLGAEVSEDRDWAAGEALAEAYLEDWHGVELPWNTERDKRNPFGSLPGADIVGFQREGHSYRLALGEVKCSSEAASPPQVMSGRSGGIGHQIDRLATDLGIVCQLLKWLHPRVARTSHESAFNESCKRYFNSDNRDVALFGVLIRDSEPRESDLRARGRALGGGMANPTTCHLIGLYLPWPISELPVEIRKGGGS